MDVDGGAGTDELESGGGSPKRRKLRQQFSEEGPVYLGPRDQHAAVHWACEDVKALSERGMHLGFERSELTGRLCQAMQDGVLLRTDYSGCGTAEESLRHLSLASHEKLGSPLGMCSTQAAGDIQPHCQKLLASHKGDFQPKCVFDDIMMRMPLSLVSRATRMQAVYLRKANVQVNAGKMTRKEAHTKYGRDFLQKIFPLVADAVRTRRSKKKLTAHCWIHKKQCEVCPRRSPSHKGWLASVSGISCFDFTGMGLQKGWFGKSALPFVQWLAERVAAEEDFCIVECVPQFVHQHMHELVASTMDIAVLEICPTLFGDPVVRKRKYMILTRKKAATWDPIISKTGFQQSFEMLFARTTRMCGDDKLCAPEAAQEDYVEHRLRLRACPPRRASGRLFSSYQSLAPGQKNGASP